MLFLGIGQLVVPPALVWLMQAEQLTFRAIHRSAPPSISALAFIFPVLTLVSAILVDLALQRARKHNISGRQLGLMLGGAVLVGCIPFSLANPVAIVDTIANLNPLGLVLTVALAIPGTYVGIQLGQNIGKMMSVSER